MDNLTKQFNIFLDDQRMPCDAYDYEYALPLLEISGTVKDDWIIVRNYKDFRFLVSYRIPDMVSFDHDLHMEHIRHYFEETEKTGIINYELFNEKTGKDCAEFLVEKWKASDKKIKPRIFIHSANDFGRASIRKALGDLA